MSEASVHLMVKIFLLISAFFTGVIQNIASNTGVGGDFVDRSFDYSFTVGLMALFIIYMIFENWSKDRKKDTTQDRMTDLLITNIEAIKGFSETNKDIAKTLERMDKAQTEAIERSALIQTEALNRLTGAFEKLESKL